MDYEQKYKEALERAEKELQACGSQDCDAARQIFRFFPELAESKDERIRKGIIRNLQYLMDRSEGFVKEGLQERITWLEKQGNKSVNIDIESMVSSYKQRLKSQGCVENSPLVNTCLTAFRHGVENALEELNLKKLEEQGEKKTTDNKEKLDVLNFIRKETYCGLAEANNALLKLIKVLKEHPLPIMDKPCKLKIEWEK